MTDFDERDALQSEYNTLASQQEEIRRQYDEVSKAVNDGKLDMAIGANAKMDLQNAQQTNNARMAQLHSSLKDIRQKEITQLRKEIPGWDTEQGFTQGAKRLGEFLKKEGYPDNFIATATPNQLKNLEELRQSKTKKGATDFDLQNIAKSRGRNYTPKADHSDLAKKTGLPEKTVNRMSDKQRKRFAMEF